MTPDEKKIYNKEYHEKNKEKSLQYMKEYREKHREKIAQQKKEWYGKNREKLSQQQKEYRQTPQAKKSNTISCWKKQKIIFHDWDLLYDIIYTLTSHCDHCNVFLEGNGSNRKCLDHDHSITDSDNVRNVLCLSCNVKRG